MSSASSGWNGTTPPGEPPHSPGGFRPVPASDTSASRFGREFTQHPVLPIWKLHARSWKDDPTRHLADWNPRVGLCSQGVPILGDDVP